LSDQLPEIAVWDEKPKLVPCTSWECGRGHRWNPLLRVVECAGCKTQVLAIKMTNCPFCNEPAVRMRLRVEHVPTPVITAVCMGHPGSGETMEIELRVHEEAING
jgi:hypothetical protein